MVTETDRIAEGLDLAARIWPDDETERATLLRHLIEAGIASCELKIDERKNQRLKALEEIKKNAHVFAGMWPENWNEDRLAEWPE